MARVMVNDRDYLAACVHGRRSRVADAERLDGLCRLRTLPELSHAVFPDADFQSCAGFQRRALGDFILELSQAPRHLDEASGDLVAWMLARFRVENMKVLLRGSMHQIRIDAVRGHLVSLPDALALDAEALLAANTPETFADRLPRGMPRQALRVLLATHGDPRRPFLLEAALDRGYFQELLNRATRLSGEDKALVTPLIDQEVNTFQLMLVARGRFGYDLTPALLLPLHLRWCGLPTERFTAMLAAPDLRTAATYALGRAVDALPAEPEAKGTSGVNEAAALEALAWKRYLRLAQRALRRSHMGLGAIIGYFGIRRVEVANLITLAEGARIGAAPDLIRPRLIPRRDLEAAHV